MLIYVIPAIYPSFEYPQSGIFVQEHCAALRKYTNHDFVVLNATTVNYKNWKQCGIIKEYDDVVGHVVQRFTPGFMQSRFPKYAIKSYEKNVLELFELAIGKYGKPDLIYAHFSFPSGDIASRISKRYSIPYIVDEHYSLYLEKNVNNCIINITRDTIENASAFLCVSEQLKNAIIDYTKTEAKITVIPNLINDRYSYRKRVNKDQFIFFSAGNFFKNKNFELLIDAFSAAFSDNNSVKLLIAGDGELKPAIEEKVSELKLEKSVELLGRLNSNQMLEQYIISDCFVLLSGHETFGIVYREAMAVGRPVISSKNGGIDDGWCERNGYIVKSLTVQEAARALVKMVENYEQFDLKEISDSCRLLFSEKEIALRVESILNSIQNM